jgi:hypothetical protein
MLGTNPSLATWVEKHQQEAENLVGRIKKIHETIPNDNYLHRCFKVIID